MSDGYRCTGADYHLPVCGGTCGRIGDEYETQTGESLDFERGLASCLRHRCTTHMAVPILNETAGNGSECGGCIQSHERDKGVMMARTAVEHKLRSMEKALESKASNTLVGKAAAHHMSASGDIAAMRLSVLAVLDALRLELIGSIPAEFSISALIGKAWRALPDHRCPTCQHNRASDGTAAGPTCDRPAVLCEEHGGHDWCHGRQMERETLWRELLDLSAEGRTGGERYCEIQDALGLTGPKAGP